MAATTPQALQFGGVDARSNALNMPLERSIRCKNWIITEAGYLRLRDGYSQVPNSAVSYNDFGGTHFPSIHSLEQFHKLNGGHYVLIGAGSRVFKFDLATPGITDLGDIGSTGKWQWALSKNKLYGANGAGLYRFDGSTLVGAGLRSLTADEVRSVVVAEGVRELTAAERAAVTLTPNSGGTFPADTYGRLVYCVLFDPTVNERGPATQFIGTGRAKPTLNTKIDIAVLPNISSTHPGWVKLFAISEDGALPAHFCTNTSTDVVDITISGTTATVQAIGHGLSTGDVVIQSGVDNTSLNEVWSVTVTDVDHYTITLPLSLSGTADGAGGKTKRIVKVSDSATTASITGPTVDTSIIANEDRGIPASTVTAGSTVTPGYQFYVSLYDKSNGGHVGNRISIGARIAPTTRCNIRISGLPASLVATPIFFVPGRTGDGGVVPDAVMDLGGNRISIQQGKFVSIPGTITDANTDGTAELPTRNGMPVAMDKIVRVGDYLYGNEPHSATIRRSGSEQNSSTGYFVGTPADSWAPNDIDTFPTGEEVTCLAEQDYELVAWSLNDMAVLSDVSGVMGWRGPWNVGCAGKRATAKTPYGRFWVTGDKELATVISGIPVAVSGEYEDSLLAKIGDAYISEVEVAYEKDTYRNLDRLIIKCRDASGNPFLVYHDFMLRDGRSDQGQGYEAAYLGPLSADFTIAQMRDASGILRIYAGSSATANAGGSLYEIENGNSDAGTDYTSDGIFLINLGIGRQAVETIAWQGDQRLAVSIATRLNQTLSEMKILCSEGEAKASPDGFGSDNFKWEVINPYPELLHAYLRLQLSSHGGSMLPNDPPHFPLEDYGRVYAMQFRLGRERGPR